MYKKQSATSSLIILLIFLFATSDFLEAGGIPKDIRYCGGYPERSSKTVREFRKLYYCPSTGSYTGACPGWQVDHVLPLRSGGCDSIENMQWLPEVIKTGKKDTCSKDRWERKIYGNEMNVIDWDSCYIK